MVRKRFDVQEDLQTRVQIFGAITAIALLVLIGRLWFLQIIMASSFNEMAQNNRVRELRTEAVRGNIYDRYKRLMVASRPAVSISVVPYIFNKKKQTQMRLSRLLGMSMSEIRKRMKDKRTAPLQTKVIKRSVEEKIVYYIKERPKEFEGVKVDILPERDYIYGSLASHLFGYVGEVSDAELKKRTFKGVQMGDLVGKTGLENHYNNTLMGIAGGERLETNAAGRPVRVLNRKKATAGSSVMLTLDLKIQKYAEEALAGAVGAAKRTVDKERGKKYAGKGGAVVVMDPRNGDVLAMASNPTYSPNIFLGGIKPKDWKEMTNPKNNYPINNRAIMSSYPAGSTFKPFVAAAALQERLITAGTTFSCSGSWKGSSKWPNSWDCWLKSGHGLSNLYRAITISCDVYFYNVGYRLYQAKGEPLQHWSKRFGFDAKTGIGLPFETGGRVPTRRWKIWFNRGPGKEKYRIWYPGDSINLSIGQGDLLVSPIQMANALSAMVNGGTLYEPRLVKAIVSPDGDITRRFKSKTIRKVGLKGPYMRAIRQGMKGVTSGEGTASGTFGGFQVPVAGKTGTAEMRGKQPTAWFISYAPADKPRYVIIMVIEEGGHGGSVAAPAIKNIYSKIFNLKPPKPKKGKEGGTTPAPGNQAPNQPEQD